VIKFVVRSKYVRFVSILKYLVPLSVIPFLDADNYCKVTTSATNLKHSSPRLLFLISNTLKFFILPISCKPYEVNLLLFNCNFVISVRYPVITLTPISPIWFSPKRRDFNPLNDCNCRISSSQIDWLGRSIY
jgi:hypothetical protein